MKVSFYEIMQIKSLGYKVFDVFTDGVIIGRSAAK